MTLPIVAGAVLVGGTLTANATSITAPYGGTDLGTVGAVDLLMGNLFRVVMREEDNSPEVIIRLGGPVEMIVTIKGFEAAAVQRLFAGGAATPRIDLLDPDVGEVVVPLNNILWSPGRGGFADSVNPSIVLRDVVAINVTPMRSRVPSYRLSELKVRLIATNVSDALGGVGESGIDL